MRPVATPEGIVVEECPICKTMLTPGSGHFHEVRNERGDAVQYDFSYVALAEYHRMKAAIEQAR